MDPQHPYKSHVRRHGGTAVLGLEGVGGDEWVLGARSASLLVMANSRVSHFSVVVIKSA